VKWHVKLPDYFSSQYMWVITDSDDFNNIV